MKKLLVACVLVFGSVGFAADSGCGLGSLIFKENTKVPQLLSVTTNGSFGSQTFGISSGTSNCSASGFAKADKEQLYFVHANYGSLTEEMAKGQGETLRTLAHLLGCSEESTAAFSQLTQKNFNQIVQPKETPTDLLIHVREHVKSDAQLAGACKHVG